MRSAEPRIVDAHVHLALDEGMRVVDRSHGADDYLAEACPAGVEAAAVLAMAPREDPRRTRQLNDLVLSAELGLVRALPFCSVHPHDGAAALGEVDRVAREGASALKLHPNTQDFDVADPRVTDVVRRAGEHGLPVLFDAYAPGDPAQVDKFVQLARACPDARIVLAHMNGPRFPEMLVFSALALYDWWPRQVWFDLSWVASTLARSPFADQLLWVCRELGTDRIVFGSDYPLVSVADALDGVRALGFTDDELDQVLGGNAWTLYGAAR